MSSLQPLWVDRTDQRRYERLTGEVEAEVVVIGAGIVGATAALLLRQQGLRVVLLEALRVAAQVTGGGIQREGYLAAFADLSRPVSDLR